MAVSKMVKTRVWDDFLPGRNNQVMTPTRTIKGKIIIIPTPLAGVLRVLS
jgi:hypothetical protein